MKPLKEIQFRPIEGIWRDVTGDSGTLAETLERLNIIIDDKTQFARIYDYANDICIYYRASAMKIRITIWKINTR